MGVHIMDFKKSILIGLFFMLGFQACYAEKSWQDLFNEFCIVSSSVVMGYVLYRYFGGNSNKSPSPSAPITYVHAHAHKKSATLGATPGVIPLKHSSPRTTRETAKTHKAEVGRETLKATREEIMRDLKNEGHALWQKFYAMFGINHDTWQRYINSKKLNYKAWENTYHKDNEFYDIRDSSLSRMKDEWIDLGNNLHYQKLLDKVKGATYCLKTLIQEVIGDLRRAVRLPAISIFRTSEIDTSHGTVLKKIESAYASCSAIFICRENFDRLYKTDAEKKAVLMHELMHLKNQDALETYCLNEFYMSNKTSVAKGQWQNFVRAYSRYKEKRADIESFLMGKKYAQGAISMFDHMGRDSNLKVVDDGDSHPLFKTRLAWARHIAALD